MRQMEIRGYILDVMESMPLQLFVRGDGGKTAICLLDDTVVKRGGVSVDPGVLVPGMRVIIHGNKTLPNGMLAERIEILD